MVLARSRQHHRGHRHAGGQVRRTLDLLEISVEPEEGQPSVQLAQRRVDFVWLQAVVLARSLPPDRFEGLLDAVRGDASPRIEQALREPAGGAEASPKAPK
jgi:hypothetical protein